MSQIITVGKTKVRRSPWFWFLRVALGLILIWKGMNFIHETAILEFLTNQSGESIFRRSEAVMLFAAAVLTLLFGIFIMAGVFTRIAAFLQLPLFLMGMLLIHGGNIERSGLELSLTIVVPFLLLAIITKDNHVLFRNSQFPKDYWHG